MSAKGSVGPACDPVIGSPPGNLFKFKGMKWECLQEIDQEAMLRDFANHSPEAPAALRPCGKSDCNPLGFTSIWAGLQN